MKIGMFPAISGRRGGGVETYEHNLLRTMAAAAPQTQFHAFCLSQAAASAFALHRPNVTYQVLWPPLRWLSFSASLPWAIRRSDVDLVHATLVPPLRCSKPLVVSIYDICIRTHHELYPRHICRRLNTLLYNRLKTFRHILCPTQTSRDLLLEHFQLDEQRLSVIPLGIDEGYRPMPREAVEPVLHRYGVTPPYFLFSGNLRVGNKNLLRLLEAFHAFRQRSGDEVQLVLTGQRSWHSQALDEALEKWKLRAAVIETGWVPPEDLPAIYSGASLLLFPSLCEGFGLPAVEAMACGTPVITSNLSCLPEVTGGAALLVDPRSVSEITEAALRLYGDQQLQADLRARGLDRARQYTWERTARETLAAYAKALAH